MTITSPRASAKSGYSIPEYWEFGNDVTGLAEWVRQVVETTNNILNKGISNAVGTVTLDASATTTTLSDRRLGANSRVFFTPTTENARAAGVPAVTSKGQYTATLTHTNTADVDKTYDYMVVN